MKQNSCYHVYLLKPVNFVIVMSLFIMCILLYSYTYIGEYVSQSGFSLQIQRIRSSFPNQSLTSNESLSIIVVPQTSVELSTTSRYRTKSLSYNGSSAVMLSDTTPPFTTDTILEWIDISNHTVDYGDQTCKQNQWKDTFVRLLNHWVSISKSRHIPYFLVYGSLIGAVRNADFIPWDHDMDILVDEAHYETLARIDNKRNFNPGDSNDTDFHLVVQNFFRKEYDNMHKPRENCLGQVNLYIVLNF